MTAPEQWDGTAFDAWGDELVAQVHEEGARLDAAYQDAIEDITRHSARLGETFRNRRQKRLKLENGQ